jgi:exodeoxyribonuclease-3
VSFCGFCDRNFFMKIMSWNINSVRLRAPIVVEIAQETTPDIICLQETKCPDESFPFKAFQKAGYDHIHINGMKSYNGQAILSKRPFEATEIYHRVGREDCRHIMARVGGIDIHNLYIPAGGDEPDSQINDKYKHKLDFVDEMTSWFADNYSTNDNVVALGDFNIAPHEHDVWSSKQLRNVVSHTQPEITRLMDMQKSIGFTDSARHFISMEDKAYSWWSYRNKDWKKSNRGRRLDHIWVTEPLKSQLQSYNVFSHARDFVKPSDHAPIMIELN